MCSHAARLSPPAQPDYEVLGRTLTLHASDEGVHKDYYVRAWDKVLIKWRDTASIQQALAADTPLEQWRLFLNERYDLNLSKLSPQYDRLRNR